MQFYIEPVELKKELRTFAKQLRKKISPERRKEASEKLLKQLSLELEPFSLILSFASFGDEIDLWPLNQYLLERTALCLPDSTSKIFKIQDMHEQLHPSTKGFLESDANICESVHLENLDAILVPGLLFDKDNYRIGYGGGFYDRLLAKTPAKVRIFGVGFLEQFSEDLLPREKHDIPVKKLVLL